jgi:hypothetical protein
MFGRYYLIVAIAFLLSSCFKEDQKIILPQNESIVQSFYMGNAYQNQYFFNLEKNEYTISDLSNWDLAFSTSNENTIRINYGRDIFAYNTNKKQLELPVSISPSEWKYDYPAAPLDSTVFNGWQNADEWSNVYIVDLGRSLQQKDRYLFLQIKALGTESYKIKFGYLSDTTNQREVEIPKNENVNFVYYSFQNQKFINDFEPKNTEWDILFTRYRHIFYLDPEGKEPFPYLVTGVLLNPNKVSMAIDSVSGFENISLASVQNLDFSTKEDGIGYAWKNFDYTVTFAYTINPNNIYVVKNASGSYFKIKFLDFYNKDKQRGYPKFEFQKILR